MTKSHDRLRAELAALGERRAAARDELAETSREIPKIARRAHKAGIPKVEIARLAQISRPALDTMLNDR